MTCIAMQPLITSCCYEGMRMLHAVYRYGLRSCGDRETGQLASAPPPRAGAARRRPRPIPQPRARELSSAGRRGAAGKWRAKPSCGFFTLFCHRKLLPVFSGVYCPLHVTIVVIVSVSPPLTPCALQHP